MAETEGATGEGLSEAELERALAARRTLLARFASLASRLVGGDVHAASLAGDETEAETGETFGETSPLEDRLIAASLTAESAEEAAALIGGGIVVALAPLPPPVRAVAAPIFLDSNTRLARVLHRHPGTRVLLPALPLIWRRAIGDLARTDAPPERRAVRAVVSRATRTTLASPRALARAIARQAARRRSPTAAGTPAP